MGAPAYEIQQEPVYERLGIAHLTKMAFAGDNLTPLATQLLIDHTKRPEDAGLLMDLSMIEQLRGNQQDGLVLQAQALKIGQLFSVRQTPRAKVKILVLAAPIRMGGNTPIEFLIEDSEIDIITLYVGPYLPLPTTLPDHDIAFVAAPGDADETRQFLDEIKKQIKNWPTAVLNNPDAIVRLERDVLCTLIADVPGVISPISVRCTKSTLASIGKGEASIGDAYPFVVRPVGSHAGRGLEKLVNQEQILPYLTERPENEFFVTQYVDYMSEDNNYRKFRVVFIAGQAYACHMAIADQWKLWYLNAQMEQSPFKLKEEQAFMETFETDFAVRHATALNGIAEKIGLEYFGIDCAETRDGELVIFEADNSLIVHDMDPEETFPYKTAQMQKVFKAFQSMIEVAAQASKS